MFYRHIVTVVCLVLLGMASSFRVSVSRNKISSVNRFAPIKMMAEDKPSYSMIPVEMETIETASAIVGGVFGVILAGPIGGLIVAAIAKYVSKKENGEYQSI